MNELERELNGSLLEVLYGADVRAVRAVEAAVCWCSIAEVTTPLRRVLLIFSTSFRIA